MLFLSEEKKERIYIARLRADMEFFGHDMSEMTDEEIKKCINDSGKLLSKCGLTCYELKKSLQSMAKLTLNI